MKPAHLVGRVAAAVTLVGLAACTVNEPVTPVPPNSTPVITVAPTTPGTRIPESWDLTTLDLDTPTGGVPEDTERPTTTAPPIVEQAHAVVTKVTDGDTFHATIDGADFTIRIIGINTPETVAPGKPVECGRPEATAAATKLLAGEVVILTPDPTQADTDRYGRLLRYADLPDGNDVGDQLIQDGHARQAEYDGPYQRQDTYLADEHIAATTLIGGWANCGW